MANSTPEAVFAAFFPEAGRALIAEVAVVEQPQLRDGPDARPGVSQYAEHRAIRSISE